MIQGYSHFEGAHLLLEFIEDTEIAVNSVVLGNELQ